MEHSIRGVKGKSVVETLNHIRESLKTAISYRIEHPASKVSVYHDIHI